MLLRMLLLIPLFVVAFADGRSRPEEVQVAYLLVLRALACLVLFAGGNLLKTLLAKLLASHFHRRAFFDKMQDALQKVGNLLHSSCNKQRTCCVQVQSAASVVLIAFLGEITLLLWATTCLSGMEDRTGAKQEEAQEHTGGERLQSVCGGGKLTTCLCSNGCVL